MTNEVEKALDVFQRNSNSYTLHMLIAEVGGCAISDRCSELKKIERRVDEIYEKEIRGGIVHPPIEGIRFVIKEYNSKPSVNKNEFA
jgi:hypothetical protein